ncbi:hypothetical protein NQ315_014053 [Exocentrus adspersus]|uniref:SET domain-containing protein n=1 Tax=Exocentrus adspersus TaxID=1586481 RepID=A0AAV8VWA4_9CUCU|nr:hypothetical protein NQ315_014053 [Exocentrus adspersus]
MPQLFSYIPSVILGLYPLGSLANHRCFPNTSHVFDESQRMVVRAAVFIQKDTEIFHSYSRIIWGTTVRLYHLMNTKHFMCRCERCRDPTEFHTYMSAVNCTRCKGNVIPINPLSSGSQWECETCRQVVLGKEVGKIMSLLGSVLKGFDNKDFHIMYKFLTGKLAGMVPENNQIAVELKYKIVWILGYEEGFTWKELSIEHLLTKQRFCKDILSLLEELRTGQCKIRGLLLYEMYKTKKEIQSQGLKQGQVSTIVE